MSRSFVRHLALTALLVSQVALAQAVDPGAAREQLKQGYALKQQGKFAEALPHLLESLRLDPQVKTLMNLADTEEHIGKLVDATRHWVQARDKAASAGDENARAESEKRLASAEGRAPRLTIVLKGAEPSQVTVKRDAVVLGAVSLGEALPSDPGAHVVLVEGDGYESRTFEVTLIEGERRILEVSPGAKSTAPTVAVPTVTASAPTVTSVPSASAASASTSPPSSNDSASRGDTQRIVGASTAGVGVVLLAVSFVELASAKSKHSDAVGQCSAGLCSAQAFSLQDDAKSDAKLGNVLALIGGLLAVGGGVTVLLAPHGSGDAAGLRITPPVGKSAGGVSWSGAFLDRARRRRAGEPRHQ